MSEAMIQVFPSKEKKSQKGMRQSRLRSSPFERNKTQAQIFFKEFRSLPSEKNKKIQKARQMKEVEVPGSTPGRYNLQIEITSTS